MAGDFDGKVALVTGAASGIGRASAQIFGRRGAAVLVCDVNDEGGEETVSLIEAAGGEAAYRHLDISDAAAVEAAVRAAVDTFGGLHCAHNNAGVVGLPLRIDKTPLDSWDEVIAVNLTGTFYCMKYELAHMVLQRRRRDRQHQLDLRARRLAADVRLRRQQARRDRADPDGRLRLREEEHPRQRDLPGRDGDADDDGLDRRRPEGPGSDGQLGADRPHGDARGAGRGGGLALLGGGLVRLRRDPAGSTARSPLTPGAAPKTTSPDRCRRRVHPAPCVRMHAMPKTGDLPNNTARVVEELRALILAGELEPAARLRADALAKRMGTSRTPVREALLVLEREGLVENLPNRGAVVCSFDADDLLDLYEVRGVLEPLSAARAAERITPEGVEQLTAICRDAEEAARRAPRSRSRSRSC